MENGVPVVRGELLERFGGAGVGSVDAVRAVQAARQLPTANEPAKLTSVKPPLFSGGPGQLAKRLVPLEDLLRWASTDPSTLTLWVSLGDKAACIVRPGDPIMNNDTLIQLLKLMQERHLVAAAPRAVLQPLAPDRPLLSVEQASAAAAVADRARLSQSSQHMQDPSKATLITDVFQACPELEPIAIQTQGGLPTAEQHLQPQQQQQPHRSPPLSIDLTEQQLQQQLQLQQQQQQQQQQQRQQQQSNKKTRFQ